MRTQSDALTAGIGTTVCNGTVVPSPVAVRCTLGVPGGVGPVVPTPALDGGWLHPKLRSSRGRRGGGGASGASLATAAVPRPRIPLRRPHRLGRPSVPPRVG